MSIRNLVDRYAQNRDYYITDRYNETQLRADFLDPLFELLGWDITNRGGRPTNEREVILEEPLRSNYTESTKKPDYTFRLFSERKFFLEAKKPSVDIANGIESALQVRRYGYTAKLKISVLSNFEYLSIYDCSRPVLPTDTANTCLIVRIHYTAFEARQEDLIRWLGKESVYSGGFDENWREIENNLNQFSVDSKFLDQINSWRVQLGEKIHSIIPTIDEVRLNDFVQSYLNRIIFLRVCEDRNIELYQTLLNYAGTSDFNRLLTKFEEADRRYNSGIFDAYLSNEIVKDISSVFWDIIKQLYYPESPYSFSVFSSEILGNIYEVFLSKRLVINEGEVLLVLKPDHADRDVITTPTHIIQDIIQFTLRNKISTATIDEILQMKVGDISCGSGAFLLEAYQYIIDTLIDKYKIERPEVLIQTNIETFKLPFAIKRQVLVGCIFGIDKDFNAVEACKFGLLLKLLEDENNESLNGIQILPNLDSNIKYGNSLLSATDVSSSNIAREVNAFNFGDTRYDVIIGNPPYMSSEDMIRYTPLEVSFYINKYQSAFKQYDKYYLFIERGLNLLTENGVLGYIVPSKFTKLGAGLKLRKLLTDGGYLERLIYFGANQVFQNRSTYTCLLILSKPSHLEFEQFQPRSLSEWKVTNKSTITFERKAIETLDNDAWLIVPPNLIEAYQRIWNISDSLADIVGDANIFNGIQTSANSTFVFTPSSEANNIYTFEKGGAIYQIEKEFTKPYFETPRRGINMDTYTLFKSNSRLIYPYEVVNGNANLISLEQIQIRFPLAYNYLIALRPVLSAPTRNIMPPPATPNEWHRFGRSQNIVRCGQPQKIIVGVLSQGNKYAIDFEGTYITSGGTAGYCIVNIPVDHPYSIYYIQAILNSKYLEWITGLSGEIFRGGYIARGTKLLKRLPIPRIDFQNVSQIELYNQIIDIQERLVNVGTIISSLGLAQRDRIIREREFLALKEIQDQNLNNLFGLGVLDSQIPTITEMYEID